MALLEVEAMTARYGAMQALSDVSLRVEEGEVVALMGRNGAGKSTAIRGICRMLPTTGRIAFAGRDLARLPSHRAARLGIGLVPEGRRCFAPLSVAENLAAAARPGPWDAAAVGRLFPRLAERTRQRAGSLSGGEQQMLAIGRALTTNPRLLILDEATEGLAPLVRAEIWAAVDALRVHAGLAILLVDKSLAEVSRIADRAVVLARGRSVWDGPTDALTPDLIARHVGV